MEVTPVQILMARAALKMTTQELADAAGLDKQTISRMQTGASVRPGTLARVARVLRERGAEFIESNGKVGVLVPRS